MKTTFPGEFETFFASLEYAVGLEGERNLCESLFAPADSIVTEAELGDGQPERVVRSARI